MYVRSYNALLWTRTCMGVRAAAATTNHEPFFLWISDRPDEEKVMISSPPPTGHLLQADDYK